MGEGHQRSGNSLFGEVDDRRMETERKLISLKVRHETLEKKHATTLHHLRKMKVSKNIYQWPLSGMYVEIASSRMDGYRDFSVLMYGV